MGEGPCWERPHPLNASRRSPCRALVVVGRREEARARAAKYSAAQEAARKQAAEAIMSRQDGWFGTFAAKFGSEFWRRAETKD